MSKPFVPEHIRSLTPYQPGKPIEEVERELGLTDVVKLASNENALGASPAAIAAAKAALDDVHRYPEGGAVLLTRRLAGDLGVDPRQLVFGTGSNEIIDLLIRTFAGDGEVVMSEDAFVVYALITRSVGAQAVRVPAKNFHHDLDAMADAVNEQTRLVFLANPNNPTGTIFRRADWEAFLARMPEHVVVVVDQAYFEFVDDPDYPAVIDQVGTHPGLVVLRTFSKIHGLAALRIGFGVGPVEIMDALARVRQPFNVNAPAQAAALAALDDHDFVERSRRLVMVGRSTFSERLAAMGIPFVESHANFVLIEVGKGAEATDALLHRGVIVRPMDGYGFPDHIRVTFGTADENERFFEALAEVRSGAGSAE